MKEQPQIGDRVVLTRPHGWHGNTGVYVSDRKEWWGIDRVVKIDGGGECYVSSDNQWRKVDDTAVTP